MKKIKFEAERPELMPMAKTIGSAGLDVKTKEAITVQAGERIKFGTGVRMTECPKGIFLQMELRSSIRFKLGLTQLGAGIIDSDYNGEICGLLYNPTEYTIEFEEGERIAQLVPMHSAMFCCEEYVEKNERGGGFGSTGER